MIDEQTYLDAVEHWKDDGLPRQPVLIVARSRRQADLLCREAGLAPTQHDPKVRYIFDADQLRGIERGFIVCFVGGWRDNPEASRILEMAEARETRIFYSLAKALTAAQEPTP